ncbi:MAG: ABC transporter permease [Cellvibrionaceae bacterium]|nr:ABC transporter permease [Cellvibrionaceae bacterium]
MPFEHQLIALAALVRKEVRRFMRIWVQTLIPPVVTTALYFVIFGQLIGSRIGEMGGFDYMSFVVPGLIMMSVINNSYSNVASSFYNAKFNKSVEELLVSPTPTYIILLGYVIGGVCRGLAVGIIVTVVSLVFTSLEIYSLTAIFFVILFTAVVFSLAGLINGIYANSFDDISIIPTFVLTPMTYLGGVFYSVSLLPDFWETVSRFNPVLYVVNAFRYGFLGISDVNLGLASLGVVAGVVVLSAYAMYLLTSEKLRA